MTPKLPGPPSNITMQLGPLAQPPAGQWRHAQPLKVCLVMLPLEVLPKQFSQDHATTNKYTPTPNDLMDATTICDPMTSTRQSTPLPRHISDYGRELQTRTSYIQQLTPNLCKTPDQLPISTPGNPRDLQTMLSPDGRISSPSNHHPPSQTQQKPMVHHYHIHCQNGVPTQPTKGNRLCP